MKILVILALVIGLAAGGFFAFRWFRGDSDFEDAVDDMEETEPGTESATV